MINGDHHYYDCEKYQEMLLDVAETILGWNGFRRDGLGFKARPRSFLEAKEKGFVNPPRLVLRLEVEAVPQARRLRRFGEISIESWLFF